MNLYAAIISTTLVANYLLNLLADYLNLKALREQLPEEFREVYDAEKYRQSQLYTRTKTRFGFIVTTIDLTLLLTFWFIGGFNHLDLFHRLRQKQADCVVRHADCETHRAGAGGRARA